MDIFFILFTSLAVYVAFIVIQTDQISRGLNNMEKFASLIGGQVSIRYFPFPHLFVTGVFDARNVFSSIYRVRGGLGNFFRTFSMETRTQLKIPLFVVGFPEVTKNTVRRGKFIDYIAVDRDRNFILNEVIDEKEFRMMLDEAASACTQVEGTFD